MQSCNSRRLPAVMHLVHSAEPGGAERVLCRLVEALGQSPVRHLICALRAPRPGAGRMSCAAPLHCLDADSQDRFAFVRLARLMRRENVRIVHARNWGVWTDGSFAASLTPGAACVLGFHGLQEGAAFSAAQRRRARWLGFSRRMATSVSSRGALLLEESLGFDPERIVHLPNGVDLERFHPASMEQQRTARASFDLPEDGLLIGCIANFFAWVKGHDILVEAFAKAAAVHRRARLVLAGYGPLEGQIRRRVEAAGVADRVHFLGRVEEVERLYHALDVFALASRSEGMSNAVLEAMASGLPCVLTDVSDHRSMFGKQADRLIAPVDDPSAFGVLLAQLLGEDEQHAELRVGMRHLAEQNHSFAATVRRYRDFYAATLASSTSRVFCNAVPSISAPSGGLTISTAGRGSVRSFDNAVDQHLPRQ